MLHQNLLSNHFRRELIISRQELDMFGSIQQDLKFLLSAHGLNMFTSGVTLRSLGMIMTMPIFHLQIGTMLPTAIYGSGGASLHLRYLIKEEEFVRDTILLEITCLSSASWAACFRGQQCVNQSANLTMQWWVSSLQVPGFVLDYQYLVSAGGVYYLIWVREWWTSVAHTFYTFATLNNTGCSVAHVPGYRTRVPLYLVYFLHGVVPLA